MEQLANIADRDERPASGIVRQRSLPLDVFRGMTVCLMIIVNSPGKGAQLYSFLVHAKWFGLTVADLVFPSFLFAVGNAMSFSFASGKITDINTGYVKIIRRTLIIFSIGFLLYWFPFFFIDTDGMLVVKPLSQTRVMGVLQRIALCYFVCALIVRWFSLRTTLWIAAVVLLAYWALLYLFGDYGRELTMAGNAIMKFDVFVLGEGHVYKKDVIPFDPEGILSTLPAIVNVLAGYYVGVLIQQKDRTSETLRRLLISAIILIATALCWSLIFPISKKLWTSSFVLFTVGVDMIVLAALVYLIELKRIDAGNYFFSVFGKNPLFIYLASELLHITLGIIKLPSGISIFEWISLNIFQRVFPGAFGSLMTAVVLMLSCWLLARVLDNRKIFIRV